MAGGVFALARGVAHLDGHEEQSGKRDSGGKHRDEMVKRHEGSLTETVPVVIHGLVAEDKEAVDRYSRRDDYCSSSV